MKTNNHLFYLKVIIVFVIAFVYPYVSNAQNQKKEEKAAEIKQWVNAKSFVFKAQFALPMGGSSIPLTSEYDVKVTKDSIVCYLPYFGRAYTAPLNPFEGGIRFTSKDFLYTATKKKKGGWDIIIKPRDVKSVQQITFYFSESGYGSLQITDYNRQPISFNGYYEKTEEKDKKE